MRAVFWVVTVVVAVALACFAVSNRQAATLTLWPLPYLIELPLYLLAFAILLVGFAAGAGAAWCGGRRRRREMRRRGRRIEALERELAATQSRLEAAAAAGGRPAPPAPGTSLRP